MTASTTLKMVILGEDKGAGHAIGEVGEQAEKSEGKLRGLGAAAKVALGGFLAFEAGEKTIDFLKESVEAAADDEKANAVLAKQLHNTTSATHEQAEAVEEWLKQQAEATGVARDQLTPALTQLVTATHSVSKAQGLLTLAQNVSAGSGKSLSTVTGALVRAQNGSVGGLSRLGVATKNADGSTKSFAQVQRDLAKHFKGDSAAAAKTFGGEMARLKVMFEEFKVEVGEKLLPILANLGEWFIDKGLPAFKAAGESLKEQLEPAFEKVRDAIEKVQPVLEKVGEFMKNNPGTVKVFAGVLIGLTAALGAVTLAMGALDAVMDANPFVLAAVAIAGLAAGIYYAYQHSEKFRAVVQKLGSVLGGIGKVVLDVVKVIKKHWQLIGTILLGPIVPVVVEVVKHFRQITGAVGDVVSWVKGHWRTMTSLLTGPISAAASAISSSWSNIKSGASAVVDFVRSVPGRLSNLAGKFMAAGSHLVGSIFSGIANAARSGLSFVADLASSIKGAINSALHLPLQVSLDKGPIHIHATVIPAFAKGVENFSGGLAIVGEEGPELVNLPRGSSVTSNAALRRMTGSFSDTLATAVVGRDGTARASAALKDLNKQVDKTIKKVAKSPASLVKTGADLLDSLVKGIKSRYEPLKTALSKVTAFVSSQASKLAQSQSDLSSFASGFQDFSSSVFGADMTDPDTGASTATVASILAYQQAQQAQAQALAANVKKLVSLGLSKSLLTQLQSNGTQGLNQINALAASATKAQIAALNASDKATSAYDHQAGMAAGSVLYGKQIAAQTAQLAASKKLEATLKGLDDHLKKDQYVVVEVDGQKIVSAIRSHKRKNGNKSTGIG